MRYVRFKNELQINIYYLNVKTMTKTLQLFMAAIFSVAISNSFAQVTPRLKDSSVKRLDSLQKGTDSIGNTLDSMHQEITDSLKRDSTAIPAAKLHTHFSEFYSATYWTNQKNATHYNDGWVAIKKQ